MVEGALGYLDWVGDGGKRANVRGTRETDLKFK